MTNTTKNQLTELHLIAMRNSDINFKGLMSNVITTAQVLVNTKTLGIMIEHIMNTEFTEAAQVARMASQNDLAEILDNLQVKMVEETKGFIQKELLAKMEAKVKEHHAAQ